MNKKMGSQQSYKCSYFPLFKIVNSMKARSHRPSLLSITSFILRLSIVVFPLIFHTHAFPSSPMRRWAKEVSSEIKRKTLYRKDMIRLVK